MSRKKLIIRLVAGISALAGIGILIATVYPIASYEALSRQKFPTLISPINENSQDSNSSTDYTKASNWFTGLDSSAFYSSKIIYYNISIPKLRIEDALVAVGGEDLSEHVIQYPGTALPGKMGNAVLFGHSTLPRFYDPKDYISIFSLLPTLEKGDNIFVTFDGLEYVYRVESLFEVYPTDIQILQQDPSDSFLTLVTCTPPGDPRRARRLIVRARIVS